MSVPSRFTLSETMISKKIKKKNTHTHTHTHTSLTVSPIASHSHFVQTSPITVKIKPLSFLDVNFHKYVKLPCPSHEGTHVADLSISTPDGGDGSIARPYRFKT